MNINANMTAHMANKMTFAGVTPSKELTGVKDTQKTEQLRVDERIDELKKEEETQKADTQGTHVDKAQVRPKEQRIQQRSHTVKDTHQKSGEAKEGKEGEPKQLVYDSSSQIHQLYRNINPKHTAGAPKAYGRAMFFEGQPKASNLQQFMSRFKDMVDTEIRQYVKSDNPIYTKRQLREIYTVLEQSDYKNLAKKADSRDSLKVPKSTKGTEGFNRYTLTEATNTLKIFEDDTEKKSPLADYVLVG